MHTAGTGDVPYSQAAPLGRAGTRGMDTKVAWEARRVAGTVHQGDMGTMAIHQGEGSTTVIRAAGRTTLAPRGHKHQYGHQDHVLR